MSLQVRGKVTNHVQCIQKVFRPLHFFHILLHYSLILKWVFFPLINVHTIPHNDKAKTLEIRENVLQIKNGNITFTYTAVHKFGVT